MSWTLPTEATVARTTEQYTALGVIKRQHDISELNRMYVEAESIDQAIFAEMRSNLLLVAGEHYQKRESLFYRRIRDSKELTQEQKLRLTKNHIRKICQTYANNIVSMNPGVGFSPKDEKSPHDLKVADMHKSVWMDAVERYEIDDLIDDWCDNFIQIGEVAVKIFFDPNKGQLKGYDLATDPEGNPLLDEMGQPQQDPEKPLYTGEFVFEEVYGFNLLRPPECRKMSQAEWLGIRKMLNKDDLTLKFPDKERMIHESIDDTYVIFDASWGGYYRSKNQVAVREYYFRPCIKYPNGYYYITTKEGILAEGELPGAIFPIIVQEFDKIQTTPRGRSPVKQMRPYQAEVNRSASKMAEHQITLGDDKLLIQNGTKVSAGASLPGVRSISYTGAAPTILAGRSGEQYLDYMNSQITELYAVMNVAEDTQESNIQLDPYIMLYRSARQKKKFQRYIKRFEKFLIRVVKTYLKLAKLHLDDDALVLAFGTNERVNIAEYKQLPDIGFEVKVEAQAEDIDTKLGKQIALNHVLQYVGNQLKPEDIGQIIQSMPFADVKGMASDLTIDAEAAQNDILALDRGERPPVNQYDSHPYMIKKLTFRMRKPDFRFLPPDVQQNYAGKIQAHQQMDAFQKMQIQRAEAGFIPTGGYLAKCDFYVADPSSTDPTKTKRAVFPYEALAWLDKQLQAQGTGQKELEGMGQGAQAQEADMISRMSGQVQPGMHPASGMMPGGHLTSGPMPGHRSGWLTNGMGAALGAMPAEMGMGA